LDFETRALYIKFAFEVLDLKNFNFFGAFGLGCGNPYFSNTGVATSASGLLCVLYFGRGSKTRPRSDLCASEVHNFNRVCPLVFLSSVLTEF